MLLPPLLLHLLPEWNGSIEKLPSSSSPLGGSNTCWMGEVGRKEGGENGKKDGEGGGVDGCAWK